MFFANLSAIEFLSLFAAASIATIALYLLIRSRRRLSVATLRFWQDAQRQIPDRRRRRIDQPFSLLLQILAIAALLLAIAQPRIGSPQDPGASHVLLLDSSSWMQIPSLQLETRRLALAWLRSLPPQDQVMAVRADALPTPLTPFTNDRTALATAIRSTTPSSSALDLQTAFELATQSLRLHSARPGEIVYAGPLLVSDAASLNAPPNLRILPAPAPPPNLGITRAVLRRSWQDPNIVQAVVNIRNYGPAARTVPFIGGLGGAAVSSQLVSIPPLAESQVTLQFRFPATGWLDLRLDSRDALPADDRATLEISSPAQLRVALFSGNPSSLLPLLASDPRIHASLLDPRDYSPSFDADLLILDGFSPAALPRRPAVFIRPGAAAAGISAWNPTHPITSNIRTAGLRVDSARILTPEWTDTVLASTPLGPVALARAASPRAVILGFHPSSPALRYQIATPLLFANLLQWLAPSSFLRQEIVAATPGAVSVELAETAPAGRIRVLDSSGTPLPFTLDARTLRFFAPEPSTVRVLSPSAELVFSLALPALGPELWRAPPVVPRGTAPPAPAAPLPKDLWRILVIAGIGLLVLEWALFRQHPLARSSVVLKSAAAAAAAAALFQPGLPVRETKLAVAVLADTSLSIPAAALHRASRLVSSLESARGRHTLQVLPFARSVRLPAPDEFASGWRLRSTGGEAGRATRIESAIREAISSTPPGLIPRIALLSDGRENLGSAARAAWQARQLGIPIDTFLIPGRPAPRLRLESVRLPAVAFTGERFPVVLTVSSPSAAPATLEISTENKTLGATGVQLERGVNRLTIRAAIATPGAIDLLLRLRSPALGELAFEQAISVRRPRLLFLSQDPPGMESHLFATLAAAQFDVVSSTPLASAHLDNYQIAVLNNYNLDAIPLAGKQNIERFVQQGGGLLVIGGERNIYTETKQPALDPLHRALPATVAPPRSPEGASVILIIDKSSSMEGRKMELARLAAIGVVDNLKPIDQVGILIFDNSHQWAVPVRRAEDRTMIKRLIAGITPDGGTQIAPALAEGHKRMLAASGVYKHIVLLTDGISEEGESAGVARDAAAHRITISTVGLGQDVNRAFLERIAMFAKGKAYFLTDPAALEQILLKDVMEHTGSTTVERTIRPRILRSVETLSGLPAAEFPDLKGYVRFQAKPSAETILAIASNTPGEKDDPLLTRWQFGLGRAAVFTSDAKSRWATSWVSWPGFDKFWANVLRDLLPQAQPGQATLTFDPARASLIAEYRQPASAPLPESAPPLFLLGPESFQLPLTVERLAPGLFRAVAPIGARRGLFRIRPLEESRAFPETGIYLPEPELATSGENPVLLQQISAYTGGRFNPAPSQVFDPAGRSIPASLRLWPALLALTLLLNFAELALRRRHGSGSTVVRSNALLR